MQPRPPDAVRDSIRATLVLAGIFFVTTAVLVAVVMAFLLVRDGRVESDEAMTALVVPFGAALFAVGIGVVGLIADEIARVTASWRLRRGIDRRRRRAAKRPGPPEAELLAQLPIAGWSEVRRRTMRAARLWTLRRLLMAPLIAIPSAFLAVLGAAIVVQLLPQVVGIGFAVAVLLAMVALRVGMTLVDTAAHRRGDPLVLMGRVLARRPPRKIEAPVGDGNTQAALRAASEGRGRLLELQVDRAMKVMADGRLRSAARWRGTHRIPATLSVVRSVEDGEHVVLVCSPAGWARSRLSAFC